MTEQTFMKDYRTGVVFGGSGLIGGTVVNFYKMRRPGVVDMLAPSSKKVSMKNCQDIRNYLLSIKPDFVINAAIANRTHHRILLINSLNSSHRERSV